MGPHVSPALSSFPCLLSILLAAQFTRGTDAALVTHLLSGPSPARCMLPSTLLLVQIDNLSQTVTSPALALHPGAFNLCPVNLRGKPLASGLHLLRPCHWAKAVSSHLLRRPPLRCQTQVTSPTLEVLHLFNSRSLRVCVSICMVLCTAWLPLHLSITCEWEVCSLIPQRWEQLLLTGGHGLGDRAYKHWCEVSTGKLMGILSQSLPANM